MILAKERAEVITITLAAEGSKSQYLDISCIIFESKEARQKQKFKRVREARE